MQQKVVIDRVSGPTAQYHTVLFTNDKHGDVPAGEGVMFICSEQMWTDLGEPEAVTVTVEPSP